MVKVNKKNKLRNKIFEFLTIFSMTFGIVVGTGIYMKNSNIDGGVLDQAGKNPYVAIAAWVFIGVLCSLMMLTFIEAASSSKNNEHSTPQSWTAKFLNRRTASLFSIVYVCMYMPVLASIGALFIVRTFFDFVNTLHLEVNDRNIAEVIGQEWYVIIQIIFSILILLVFQFTNMYTNKPSRWIQLVSTFTKFIPLFVAIFGGFILGIVSDGPNSFNPEKPEQIEPWGISPMFAAMVPILFAFNGFIYSATLQKDCEHKEVVAPAMLTGIIAITGFYMLISISIFISREDGNIYELFSQIINNPWTLFAFKMIILITLLTMVNAYTTLLPKTIHSAFEEGFIYSKNKEKTSNIIWCGWISNIITWFVFLTFIISSLLITGFTNAKLDYYLVANYASNSTVMFGFLIYYIIMIGVIHNRRTNKVEVRKIKGGYITGIIALCMLTIVLGYTYIDFFIFKFMDENKIKMVDPLLLLGFGIIIAIGWIINECLLSKQDIKNNDFYLRIQPKNWFKYNRKNQ